MDVEVEFSADESLRDRILLAVVKAVEGETKKHNMTVSHQAMAAISVVVLKYLEQMARDVDMFAQHAGRKSVNMDDVLLTVRRNPSVVANLMSVVEELLKCSKKNQAEKLKKKQESDDPHVEKVKRRKKDIVDVEAEKLRKKQDSEFDEGEELRRKFLSGNLILLCQDVIFSLPSTTLLEIALSMAASEKGSQVSHPDEIDVWTRASDQLDEHGGEESDDGFLLVRCDHYLSFNHVDGRLQFYGSVSEGEPSLSTRQYAR